MTPVTVARLPRQDVTRGCDYGCVGTSQITVMLTADEVTERVGQFVNPVPDLGGLDGYRSELRASFTRWQRRRSRRVAVAVAARRPLARPVAARPHLLQVVERVTYCRRDLDTLGCSPPVATVDTLTAAPAAPPRLLAA